METLVVAQHQNQYYSRSSRAHNDPARFGSFGSPHSIGFKGSPSPPSNIYCLSPCKRERERQTYIQIPLRGGPCMIVNLLCHKTIDPIN